MRRRRSVIGLLVFAAIACCASLSYFAYGKRRVAALETACNAAREAKHWGQLEGLATQWVAWQPNNAQPWLYAAEAASEQGDDIRTATYLYYLPNDDPRAPVALLELSHLQFGSLNQPIAAASTCERILRIRPETTEAHRRLIFYYAMSRQRAQMIAEANRAIRMGCDAPETYLYLFGADWITFTNGHDVNQRWLQSAPQNETFLVAAAFHRVRSSALDENSEAQNPDGTSKSEALMAELLKRFPQNIELLAFHLDLATFRGNESLVVQWLAQAPAESTEDSRFWRYKGWIHEAREEFDEAEVAYRKAIELHPFDGQVHHHLAAISRRTNKLALVEKHQSLAVLAQQIMRDCLQLPSTQALSDELLDQMASYAKLCGADLVEASLLNRLAK